MRLHYLQHHPQEGLGTIEDWAIENGYLITRSKLYEGETNFPEDIDLLIIMGGPQSVYEEDKYEWLAKEKKYIYNQIDKKTPTLGICLGAQLIASALGAKVYPNVTKEIGWFPIWFSEPSKTRFDTFKFPHSLEVFHWHGDTFDIPKNAIQLGWSSATKNQGFIYSNHVIALQFHLELTQESLKDMGDAFKKELIKAEFVQTYEEITESGKNYEQTRLLMGKILDFLKTNVNNSVG